VVFDSLGKEAINAIIENKIRDLQDRLLSRGFTVTFDSQVIQLISTFANCESYGGRDIEKVIEKSIYHPLSDFILKNREDVKILKIGVVDDKIISIK
jgi:ATP-dependent Clp protease ATP-binding subunit ClpA